MVNTGEGRFLLRVSYNPDPSDPYSKYIKIESIGRLGEFDENDPTTWLPNGNARMRREITAYKPIGVTDYLRLVTNKDSRNMDFSLGVPGLLDDSWQRSRRARGTAIQLIRGCEALLSG